MVEDDIVPVALVTPVNLLHGGRKHGIDIVVVTFQVYAVMEPGTLEDGVFPVAELGVDFQEVQG